MDIVLWLVTGAAIGWAGIGLLRYNVARGVLASVAIGAAGGLLGGTMLAPMLGAGAVHAGEFGFHALFIAAMTALALLVISNMVQNRFGD